MNDNGWIKISRNITEHWLWDDGEKLKWWLDLLLMAQWEDKKVMYDSHLYTLQRGQMLASISFLTERWKRNRKVIISFLKLLEEEHMISREVRDRQTPILTICNYDKYQLRVDTQGDGQGDTQGDGQGDTIKEYKESKEDNNRLLNSNLCCNSNELQPSNTCAHEEPDILEPEIVTDRFPWAKLKTMWNTICVSFPKLTSLSEARKNKVKVRVKEMGGQDEAFKMFEILFHKMEESNFLRGDNQRGWKATFDWLFSNPNNWVKVYEDQYHNDKQKFNYGNNTKQTTYEQRAATVARIVEEGIAASREELRNRGRVPDPVLPF